jgi:hypothetical protein
MASIAEPGSLTSRYCLVLEELRLEAMRLIEKQTILEQMGHENHSIAIAAGMHGDTSALNGNEATAAMMVNYGNGDTMDFYTSPGSSVADIASWIEFESMVSNQGPMLITLDSYQASRLFQASEALKPYYTPNSLLVKE